MISKRFTGWQARPDSGERSRKFAIHSKLTAPPIVEETRVNTGPSPSEQFSALQLLNEGSKFAHDCQQNVWEFAVEIDDLLKRGVTRSLIRWLICGQLIEHRIESYLDHAPRRQFCEAPNLFLSNRSCFVLSQKGQVKLAELLTHCQSMISPTQRRDSHAPMNDVPKEKPVWCPSTRMLKIADKVVKHFKWPAPNQEMLIAAFAEMGWPDQIDDPLPPTEVCPKRRLHDTIKCLNRSQENELIKFRGDGTGRAARWEFQPSKLED